MSSARRPVVRALVALLVLVLPAGAGATSSPTVRYATASGTGAVCTATAPCSLAVAVDEAGSGGEVIVAPGTYRVDDELELEASVSLHGVAGRPRPWLVGAGGLDDVVLSAKLGGSLRHLGIKATAPGGDALSLQNGTAEDLLLVSEQGAGGKLTGAANGTVLRDSAVLASASGTSGLKLRDGGAGGAVHLVNVTSMAPAGTGIRCDAAIGSAALVNTIARGGTYDVDASRATGGMCTADTSDFRAAVSPGLVAGSGNIAGDPLFADASIGDFRVLTGTPTDDAGATNPLLGTADPAGCPRSLGLAPDIGAYEHPDPMADACAAAPAEPLLRAPALPPAPEPAPVADTAPAPETQDDDDPAPELGHSVVAAPGTGTVRVKTPGAKRFRRLSTATNIPVGSVVDARAGRARLTSALDATGHVQSASFWGSKFEIRQSRRGRGMVDLYLRGGGLGACPTAAPHAGASIATARKRPRRSLWAKDRHGRYRTHGQSSAATARGTRWVTTDTCAGTRTDVAEGSVSVRDRVRHRTVIVRAGQTYLARAGR